MKRALLILTLAACGKSKDTGPAWTHEVSGKVTVEGIERVITRCIVEKHGDTRISLMYDGGHLSFEAGRLSLYQGDDDRNALERGAQLSCPTIRGERSHGTSPDAPGWAHGKLAADCTSPTAVTLDVDLNCGPVPPDVAGPSVTGSAR